MRSARSILTFIPRALGKVAGMSRATAAGFAFARRWTRVDAAPTVRVERVENPLRAFFDARTTGRGIWKWEHYFDIYHRHFAKFVGRDVSLVEIGIYSGGSLEMWKDYLGPTATIHGVDVEEACRVYDDGQTRVHIGDQADRVFWQRFRKDVPQLDIVVDDGGHTPEQQIVTLEELLPHLKPGGVFLCEDADGVHNEFIAYVAGLVNHLNTVDHRTGTLLATTPTPFQKAIYAVHFYPYVVVIERTDVPVELFSAPKHGTKWQPFLK
ncbi:MAG: class I SAM-dependent methyltransferase [Gemmatimonadaceae bacterium]